MRKVDPRKIASRYRCPEVEHAYWLARSLARGRVERIRQYVYGLDRSYGPDVFKEMIYA